MLEQENQSISKITNDIPNKQSRWKHSTKRAALYHLIDDKRIGIQSVPLTLTSVVNTNLYSRRHSTNSYPITTDYFSPIADNQAPAVPKRGKMTQVNYTNQNGRCGSRTKGPPPPPPPRSPASLHNSKLNASKIQINQNSTTDCVFQFDKHIMYEFGKIPPAPMGPPPPAPPPIPVAVSVSSSVSRPTTPASKTLHRSNPTPVSKTMTSQQTNPPRVSLRQDSSVSSDSFSQNSSPSYSTKAMETPLIIPRRASAKPPLKTPIKNVDDTNGSVLTKSISTPASLQTIVRFHNGSNMSLHHRIIRDMRRSSSHNYVRPVRMKFRLAQVVMNAIALLAIGGGIVAYFNARPSPIRIVDARVNTTTTIRITDKSVLNPAPGICLPVIVKFCQHHKIPYNFTVFPNYMGHFGQLDAERELEIYDAIVDVRCYELAALFLCSVFVPKCGPEGSVVRPCLGLCSEMKRRCGFFLDVFGLALPDYLECDLFPESANPEICVGHSEVIEAKSRAQRPVCSKGFQCDITRCIPKEWRCDGYLDCEDKTDELDCRTCSSGMIHCGNDKCISQKQMCDGQIDCPMAQDERSCLRLSDRNGDIGIGNLELYRPMLKEWQPACVNNWNSNLSNEICSLLGYSNTNWSRVISDTNYSPIQETTDIWENQRRLPKNLLRDFSSNCDIPHSIVNISCTNHICGKARKSYTKRRSMRIVGGVKAKPGDWPFLAALLGGPEEIFYCAGVLIADQWVLTASHCVGNHSDVSGWTIQLGITRRHAHSYYGQKMKVKRVVPHPLYNTGSAHDNDIALFQLRSRVNFHEHLLPVCLPSAKRELKEDTKCTVIGWGKKDDTGLSEYEPEINEVDVPILNRDLCNIWLDNPDLNVTEGMICAGYKEGGKDACQGDSGGPLLCRDERYPDRWFVGGIVSWGIKCAHPHLPGVYAYVPKYVSWIEQQIHHYSD